MSFTEETILIERTPADWAVLRNVNNCDAAGIKVKLSRHGGLII